MTDDKLWGMLGVKKRTTGTQITPVPALIKSVSQPVPSTQPTTVTKSEVPKVVKEKKQKEVKKVKAQMQQQSTQQPQYQLSDFRMQTAADNLGIHIITTYLGTPINQFILPIAQYANWQNSPQQAKYNYVQARTLASVFFGDMRLVQVVVTATVNAIDNMFLRSRQAQAQKRI